MANETGFTIESDYAYVLREVEGKCLNLQMVLNKPGDFIPLDLMHIGEEMVDTAKYFASMQGFSSSGNLYKNIQYDKNEISNGKIVLKDPALNPRQQYYAGHQEFGFHTRDGKFKEARPFLRPAMRAVQQASLGRISSAALEFAGFRGGMKQPKFNKHGSFGNNLGRIRAFYRQEGYTRQGLEKKLGSGQSIRENLGKSYSINRRTDAKSGINLYPGKNGPVSIPWDSPYSTYNSYKMERISSDWRDKYGH